MGDCSEGHTFKAAQMDMKERERLVEASVPSIASRNISLHVCGVRPLEMMSLSESLPLSLDWSDRKGSNVLEAKE